MLMVFRGDRGATSTPTPKAEAELSPGARKKWSLFFVDFFCVCDTFWKVVSGSLWQAFGLNLCMLFGVLASWELPVIL